MLPEYTRASLSGAAEFCDGRQHESCKPDVRGFALVYCVTPRLVHDRYGRLARLRHRRFALSSARGWFSLTFDPS